MPHSYSIGKLKLVELIKKVVPKTCTILDVGPGAGVYGSLLKAEGYSLDCVEIYKPYIKEYNLKDKYKEVFNEDILKFDKNLFYEYDFVIFGDVIEHLNIEDSQRLIGLAKTCMVAVPFLSQQGPVGGNDAETHIQDDLTPALMKRRYSTLQPIAEFHKSNGDAEDYGYYYKLPLSYGT